MAVAGKVAITLSTENGGAWSADVTYDRLVAVKHNNNLYISRKTVSNVEPPNDEFWFLALKGFSGEDVQTLIDRLNELSDFIQAIIDGTTQVGNAKTLDGHGAEYFAPLEDLGGVKILTELPEEITDNSSMQELIDALPRNSILKARRVMKPLAPKNYTSLLISKDTTEYVIAFAKSQYDKFIYIGGIGTDNKWQGWTELNLANYLPLTGGELTANAREILTIARLSGSLASIVFKGNGSKMGELGFDGTDRPAFWGTDNIARLLLHTGNKPTGSYIGNGSNANRTIKIGGIGNVLVVYSLNTIALVAGGGFIEMSNANVAGGTHAYFIGGTLYIANTDAPLNANGVTYNYQVL